MRHVFVPGLNEVHRGELATIPGHDEYDFHGLLDCDRLARDPKIRFERLLAQARRELRRFDGTVDGILTHWDFPSSIIGPILARERGLPAPRLDSLLKCEHKYWSRLEQRRSIPECVPAFCAFDPFDDHALATITVSFPFWVKPVKSHSSNLGFEVHDAEQFDAAVAAIRADITAMGDAFNEVMRLVEVPPDVSGVGGNTCVAEGLISGTQVAVEGAVFHGEFYPHGVIDMRKDEAGTSFGRLDYPAATVPETVRMAMTEYTELFLRHIGFDDGCFNAEYMWDPDEGRLWLVEVNTRISQAHSDLFAKVDGMSNHKVALDVALGRQPSMPHRDGPFAVAGQCMVFHDEDAVVTRIPDADDLARLRREIPQAVVSVQVKPGDRLSELPRQNSYRSIVAKAYIGAGDLSELDRLCARLSANLPIRYEPVRD